MHSTNYDFGLPNNRKTFKNKHILGQNWFLTFEITRDNYQLVYIQKCILLSTILDYTIIERLIKTNTPQISEQVNVSTNISPAVHHSHVKIKYIALLMALQILLRVL